MLEGSSFLAEGQDHTCVIFFYCNEAVVAGGAEYAGPAAGGG